jgi:hypothetical protein
MGAPSSDPGLEALIALLHGAAEGRVCGVSTFILDHAERRRADDANDASIALDQITDGGHEKRLSSSRTVVDEEETAIWVF